MKAVLFCYHPYAFGILKPLSDQLAGAGCETVWYLRETIEDEFSFAAEVNYTTSIGALIRFKPDAVFVPGNEVPYYLNGVKVQIFHGLAGEKKGHFRVRDYFDLYLTQGPYFTRRFNEMAQKHKNFDVIETGWSKLDPLFTSTHCYDDEKQQLLTAADANKIVLYAPTFSPSLTSAPYIIDEIEKIANDGRFLVLIKYHDLMCTKTQELYQRRLENNKRVHIVKESNILKYLIVSDLLISDTSSAIYEFMLLNKPVITFRSSSRNILWNDVKEPVKVYSELLNTFENDNFRDNRRKIIDEYHPYSDGKSSQRMITAVEQYIGKKGVPCERKLNLYRRWKINRMFGLKSGNE
ncbi:MAG: CDP-glycerol glycerophosphotransferase family protein [Cytophagaceae bacterium]|jgi:CDP-glycerol glycerophosphotransferase (TagB/SpsB family)|nr:CDP-glycerol glycerophosphotransferase family protein [Cytophagaceae bacterium]